MPNRLPPCSHCEAKKRHRPENCPDVRKREIDAPRGIQVILNGIPALVASFKLARKAIDDVLKELGG